MKKSNACILLYFAAIIAIACMTSCATTHSCEDAFRPKIKENYNSHGTNWW
jgi:hypothetical protein